MSMPVYRIPAGTRGGGTFAIMAGRSGIVTSLLGLDKVWRSNPQGGGLSTGCALTPDKGNHGRCSTDLTRR